MEKVACVRFSDDSTIVVPGDSIVFRPAAYGVVEHDGSVLLMRLADGRLFVPGGGVTPGETLVEACRREVWEETGLDVRPHEQLGFHEHFMHYDPEDVNWHCLGFFFRCELMSDPDQELLCMTDEYEGRPVWVPAATLRADDLQGGASVILPWLRGRG